MAPSLMELARRWRPRQPENAEIEQLRIRLERTTRQLKYAREVAASLSARVATRRLSEPVRAGVEIIARESGPADTVFRTGETRLAVIAADVRNESRAEALAVALRDALRAECQIDGGYFHPDPLALDEFVLWYQPVFDNFTNVLSGFEALLRWEHLVDGIREPSEFLPVAQEMGLMSEITHRVLRKAAAQAATWARGAHERLFISVNLTAESFAQAHLLTEIESLLAEYELRLGALRLEISDAVAANVTRAGKRVSALKELGIPHGWMISAPVTPVCATCATWSSRE